MIPRAPGCSDFGFLAKLAARNGEPLAKVAKSQGKRGLFYGSWIYL
jgi:hypothetical protein